MKNIFSSFTIIALTGLTLFSCKEASNKNTDQHTEHTAAASETQAPQPSEQSSANLPAEPINEKETKTPVKEEIKSFSISPIIKDYLELKNALTTDNDKAAASAGKKLLATIKNTDMKSIPANKHKEYMDIADDAKENAEHIGDNVGKIDHQREHMAPLSQDMADLIALFGTTQKLYRDYCPMFNDGKGAVWISESKSIKNPYYGSKMLTCGSVKKEY
ncbi:Protein of unknown function [Chryseobacterium oleae]|uniref:DUF3347 domain-containing protein n=1 Tax=Chryseobacterium oleae TaxID=491207 RepID=A0A1I4WKM1_CHROL|nr:DUF3347 domain-containing protein [Chryseobacterium oleae]SFN14331.1 Protein of unknown function [Chryseobacterium oleae]